MPVQFDANGQLALNILLGFLMFGVALDLRLSDLRTAFQSPRPMLVGLLSQLVALPAITLGLVLLWQPAADVALGLFLVAACPGGNVSNYLSALARADVALSVSLTSVTTLTCVLLTPLNFGLWASLYAPSAQQLSSLSIGFWGMLGTVVLLLVLPIGLAILAQWRWPILVSKIKKWIQMAGGALFILFIALALIKNSQILLVNAQRLLVLVALHNALAFAVGFGIAKAFRLGVAQVRTVCIETGIQNAGLGLVLALSFFPGRWDMALVAAIWGIWHLIAGSTVAGLFRLISIE